MLLDGQSRQSAWPLRPPPNFLPQDPRVQEKEVPPQVHRGLRQLSRRRPTGSPWLSVRGSKLGEGA